MTNTLHRFGDADSFHDDYIVFAIPAKGKNDAGSLPKLRKFLEMALAFHPINLGDARNGGALRPRRDMDPTQHWRRSHQPDFQAVIQGLDAPTTVSAVFDNREAAEGFLKAVKEADLGMCVTVSTSLDGAEQICWAANQPRHSINYSLGFEGRTDQLPNRQILMLSTMCGHGMVSHSLCKKMVDWVKEGRRSPPEAAAYLARFCSCGIFNTTRAARIIDAARRRQE